MGVSLDGAIHVPLRPLADALSRDLDRMHAGQARDAGWSDGEIKYDQCLDPKLRRLASSGDLAERAGVTCRTWDRWARCGTLPMLSTEAACDRSGLSPWWVWSDWRIWVARDNQAVARARRARIRRRVGATA